MMATFMAAVESTIVATAMPTIVAELGDFHLFSWVFVVYLLFQAVSIPIYGRLSDLYGRKRIFFAGASIFLLGSTLCGFAQGMFSLIAFRALQGMGAGAVQPVAYAIVGDVYTPTERARVQGFLSSVFGISAIVGPTLGAFLVEHASWSVVFWINLPIGALAMAMLAAFLRERPHGKPPSIDYLASFLLMLGAGALMMAMIQGASLDPWLWRLASWSASSRSRYWCGTRPRTRADVADPVLTNRVIALGTRQLRHRRRMMSVSAPPTYIQGVGAWSRRDGPPLAAMSISWAMASIMAGRLISAPVTA
jgi:MFS family permease